MARHLKTPPVGVEPTHTSALAERRQSLWPQRLHIQCPRQESNLVCNLRRVACDPAHSKDTPHTVTPVSGNPPPPTASPGTIPWQLSGTRWAIQHDSSQSSVVFIPPSVLARSRTWSTTFARSRAIRHTPRTFLQHPAEESNLVRRFRKPSCLPHTRRAQPASLPMLIRIPKSVSNPVAGPGLEPGRPAL